MQLNLDPEWSDFIMRITSHNLDSFRYERPPERDLTDVIRNAVVNGTFSATVNWNFQSRPNWQE
jgi:hypothetical protein